ncbi:metallophosphoesterase [Candidatus Poribacteria bacterium]|nr:metallophosphoesterase [Candidatus Poribacteria bacterium]
MKIGVISDTHDNLSKIKQAVELFNAEGVELVIHAGDISAPFAAEAMNKSRCRVIAVLGNNDGEKIILAKKFENIGELHANMAQIEVGGKKIAVVHYSDSVEALALSGQFDIVIYGHTHKIDVRKEKTLVVNPGEGGGWVTGKCTVALIDLDKLDVEIREL